MSLKNSSEKGDASQQRIHKESQETSDNTSSKPLLNFGHRGFNKFRRRKEEHAAADGPSQQGNLDAGYKYDDKQENKFHRGESHKGRYPYPTGHNGRPLEAHVTFRRGNNPIQHLPATKRKTA